MGEISRFAEVFTDGSQVSERKACAIDPAVGTVLSAVSLSVNRYATIALRDAATGLTVGQIGYVFAEGGSTSDADNGFYQWTGSAWVRADWIVNQMAGIAGQSGENTVVGAAALAAGVGTEGNTAIGSDALGAYEGDNATGIGRSALFQVTGIRNTALGAYAGAAITTGEHNVFIGWNVGGGGTGQVPTANNTITIGYNIGSAADGQIVIGGESNDELRMFGVRMNIVQPAIRNFSWGPQSGNRTASGGANTAIGFNVLPGLTTGTHNVAIGDNAASSHLTGTGNVWIGSAAGRLSTACIDVVHIGWEAGELQAAGVGDTGVGRRALGKAGYAAHNTCVGDSTGWSLNPVPVNPANLALGYTGGFGNVIMGYVAGEYNVTGAENVIIGGGANSKATSGDQNVILGSQAMITNTGAGGNGNIAIGYSACRDYAGSDATVIGAFGFFQASGMRNTGVGASVGGRVTTGANNTFVGWGAGADTDTPATFTNAIAIGYNVNPTQDNQVVIGNAANDEFVFGGVVVTRTQISALLALL